MATFLWGLWKTITVIMNLVSTGGQDPLMGVRLIELMDKFLIAVGLYEFFISKLDLRLAQGS